MKCPIIKRYVLLQGDTQGEPVSFAILLYVTLGQMILGCGPHYKLRDYLLSTSYVFNLNCPWRTPLGNNGNTPVPPIEENISGFHASNRTKIKRKQKGNQNIIREFSRFPISKNERRMF